MITEIVDKLDYITYENFIINNQQSTFYHSIKHLIFLQQILQIKPKFIVTKNEQDIVAVMPFFTKKSTGGEVINSLPFFGSYGGSVAINIEAEKNILTAMNDYNKENDVLSSTIITNPFTNKSELYQKYYEHTIKENRLVQCLVLDGKQITTLWENFEQRVRRAVRKSMKCKVNSRKLKPNEKDFSDFYNMHKLDMESKNGKPKPPEFFQSLKDNFVYGKDYEIFAASLNDLDIAYLLVFYYGQFTEYYMPAYNVEFKNLQATSLLIWESIKEAINRKSSFYNFGGTWKNQPELYLYKRGWAAMDFPYAYYIYGNISRAKEIGLNEIIKQYPFFYVFPYETIRNS
ncbi:MAG: GNAT family N-acetyltransferase [Candidatus Nitrosotenuis sp.]